MWLCVCWWLMRPCGAATFEQTAAASQLVKAMQLESFSSTNFPNPGPIFSLSF
jgi:hypothetical protein